jgi:hypothetical protein
MPSAGRYSVWSIAIELMTKWFETVWSPKHIFGMRFPICLVWALLLIAPACFANFDANGNFERKLAGFPKTSLRLRRRT